MAAPDRRAPGGTTVATKVSVSAGIIAAMVLAVLVNVLAARHYRRWDWTRGGLYTLSDATVQTLGALEEPVKVYVLLGADDPLTLSVRHLLDAYRAETTRLEVEYTDPDRRPAEFLALQQRYGIAAGKTEDGRIATDASIIVARGDRPHFLTSHDLVAVEDEEDMRARPRLEHALTGAIRSVLSTEQPRACFTGGHGERSIDVGGSGGLAALKDRLVKDNFEVVQLGRGEGGEAGDEHEHDPDHERAAQPAAPGKMPTEAELAACRVLIVAAPSEPLPAEEVARYRRYLEQGGNVLVVTGPVPDADDQRYLRLGLDALLAAAGVKLQEDFVFEIDPRYRSTQGFGETFLPIVRPHPITEGLIKEADQGLGPVLTVASSLALTGSGSAAPVPILVTSDQAFGMVDFFGWAKNPGPPSASEADHRGPLTIAVAAELPKPAGSTAPYGPRAVVLASPGVLLGANWQSPELRGTAVLLESALSWLSARPAMLDIPDKPAFTAGMRVSEASLASIFRYVVLFMPLAAALLGAAVYLQRRAPKGARRAEDAAPGRGRGPKEEEEDQP